MSTAEQRQHLLSSEEDSMASPRSTQQAHGGSMFHRILNTLYGKLPPHEVPRVLTLSVTFFFIVGAYWLLRSLKDTVFATIVGLEYQPKAKMLSLVVVLGLVFVYNKLIDKVKKHQLFYVIGAFYFGVFFIISMALARPGIGLSNTEASPDRWLGWISYFAIESFGSLGVSVFWAFVNSVVNVQLAESAYGIIIAGAQVGAILGPTLATMAKQIGVPLLYAIGSLEVLVMTGAVYYYSSRYGSEDHSSTATTTATGKKEKPGLLDGLKLMYKYPYVLGIFAIGSLFEVIVTIVDYQMKVLAKQAYTSTEDFAQFMGHFGQAVNTVSLVFSLLGTSFVIRRFGLRYTLMSFPVFVCGCVLAVYFSPNMWILFLAMIVMKGLAYALNNPSKEMLYIPTTKTVKFKSKSWIDMFGGRGSKAVGSTITDIFKEPISRLLTAGTLVSLMVAGLMFAVASRMGLVFERLTSGNVVIGTAEDQSEQPRELRSVAAK